MYREITNILSEEKKEIKKKERRITAIIDIYFEYFFQNKTVGKGIANFILKYINDIDTSVLLKSENQQEVDAIQNNVHNIINLHRINDIRYINKYFESVNNKLKHGGIFVGCVETFVHRKKKFIKKFPKFLAYPFYTFDFVFKRIFPKFFLTKKLYYSVTKGKNRQISLSETLGRLVSCGFEILGFYEIDHLIYFAAKRICEPAYDNSPSYGFIIRLKRVGEYGKIINVYKFRTMYPYSEYLQKYICDNNALKDGGKFKQDFRITHWGKVMRKYRFDEIPMIWNFLKGDLKFFGVRPLSLHYYNLYEEDIRIRRIRYKPGLIPPFFADLPKSFNDILESERNYLDKYDKHPFITDWKYFWKVFYNINVHHVFGE